MFCYTSTLAQKPGIRDYGNDWLPSTHIKSGIQPNTSINPVSWYSGPISYFFPGNTSKSQNFGLNISEAQVEFAVQTAFQVWTDATYGTLQFVKNSNPLNAIYFYGGAPSGGALAYTAGSGPYSTITIVQNWTWTISPQTNPYIQSYDLVPVMIHEIGHALGFNHSTCSNAIMYYQNMAVRKLSIDDIKGIRSYYGYSHNDQLTPPNPSVLCSSGATITLNPVYNSALTPASFSNIQWIASPGLQIKSGQGSSPVVVGRSPSAVYGSNENIHAVISDCNLSITTDPVFISIGGGQPQVTSISSNMSGGCNNGTQTWYVNATTNTATTYNWQWTVDNSNPGIYINRPNQPGTFIDVARNTGGGVSVTFTDECGAQSSKTGVTIYSNCGYYSAVNIYPNPSSSIVTVDFNTQKNQSLGATNNLAINAITLPETVDLFNSKTLFSINTLTKNEIVNNQNNATFNVKGLKPGFYYIHLNYKDNTIEKTVQIY